MARFVSVAALTVLAAIPQALAGNLIVHNQCPFTIWCGAAKNDGTSSPAVPVASGQRHTSPKPANNDNIGAVLKCSLDASLSNPYQLEMAVQYGKSWVDLSNLDGNPFLPYHRHAEIPGTSCTIDCQPGDVSCEWPYSVDCYTINDVIMSLC